MHMNDELLELTYQKPLPKGYCQYCLDKNTTYPLNLMAGKIIKICDRCLKTYTHAELIAALGRPAVAGMVLKFLVAKGIAKEAGVRTSEPYPSE
jgi:hypothetical protein